MTAHFSNGQTSVRFGCSVVFKERLAAYAAFKGMTITDTIIEEMAGAMKFHDFEKATDTQARADDWNSIVALTDSGQPI